MTKEDLLDKQIKSGQDCETCEFKVVPVRIQPCMSCSIENPNWETGDKRKRKMD